MNGQTLRRLLLPLVAFVVSMSVGLYLVRLSDSVRLKESRLVGQQLLAGISSEIERHLAHTLTSTYLLEQEVVRSGGRIEGFEPFAQSILKQLGGISNLQLAPDGVIARIHPLAGNEAAIGHDILRDDLRRDEALAAVESRELTLAGPFTLRQGGVGVIARNPVFLPGEDVEDPADDRFWGFTSALIMLDDLLKDSGLSTLAGRGYGYRLQRFDPRVDDTVVFGGDPALDGSFLESIDIVVPNGVWTLTLAIEGEGLDRHAVELLAALLVALGLTAYCHRVVEEPLALRRKVAEQTLDLERLAYTDSLTGLPNRNRFLRTLGRALEGPVERGRSLALLLLDLDHFKHVNDILGHEAGDRLLCEAARRMLDGLPVSATLARLGGDEFTVIVQEPDALASAERVARRIIETVGAPFRLDGREAYVSASIGIALPGEGCRTVSNLLKCADQAMYQAKHGGRGGFCVFDLGMQQEAAGRAQMTADLHVAVQEGQFEILYQPIVCVATGRVTKAEALLRWNHPVHGIVSPMEFIPLAEQNGLIHPIGEWVFARVVEQAAHWRKTFEPTFQASINVSPAQLRLGPLASRWRSIVERAGTDPSAILVEITESVLLEENERGKAQLWALRAEGFSVALDDFGTGYSSLSYLRELSVDYLKIDKCFVQRIDDDEGDLALCRAIISLARQFGLRVVAEGVETAQQERLLGDERIDFLQGYLYSRPITVREFEARYFAQVARRAA